MSVRAVECECHEVVPVPEGSGRTLKCGCGRYIVVPSAEEFVGQSVVLSAATLKRRIQRLVTAGQLPPDRDCAWCGASNSEPVDFQLVCERSRARTGGRVPRVVLLLLLLALAPIVIFPGCIFLLLRSGEEDVEVLGRDTTVPVPLCACEACARALSQPRRANASLALLVLAVVAMAMGVATLSLIVGIVLGLVSLSALLVGVAVRRSRVENRRQRRIKGNLARVPAYAQLLREYPFASAVAPGWVWLKDRPWMMSAPE